MSLKTLLKNLTPAASGSCDTACSRKRPVAVTSGCDKEAERARQLLAAYDKAECYEPKAPRKCEAVVKDQWKIEAVFQMKSFFVNALEQVNKGLCFAPNQTEALGILYANRAKIFAQMGLYSEAVESNKLALENNYPKNKTCELVAMQKKLLCKLNTICTPPEHTWRVTLSYPSCPKNPYIIQGITVQRNKQYGRHLITDRDLEVGDVICIEPPYIKCIQPEQIYKRCTHCLEEVPHILVPCTGCTNAMFCSEKCQEDAWTEYHSVECSLSLELMAMEPDVGRLAMRTFLIVMPLFDGEIQRLKNYLDQNKCRKITAFDLDYTRLCKKDQFLAYYNGNCADSHLTDCAKEAKIDQAAKLVAMLSKKCAYAQQLQCDQLKVFLMEFFYHLICVDTNNCYEIGSPSLEHEKIPTCLGLFLRMSMASHSCSGNVTRLRVGETMRQMWVVTHFIPEGSQIFDNYGAFFMNQPLAERQKRLKEHYGFVCKCEACAFNFPMAQDMSTPEEVPWPGISYLKTSAPLTVPKLKAELKSVKDFITRYDYQFPCKQLREAEIRLVNLFRTASNDDTLRTKYPEFTTEKSYAEIVDEMSSCDLARPECAV